MVKTSKAPLLKIYDIYFNKSRCVIKFIDLPKHKCLVIFVYADDLLAVEIGMRINKTLPKLKSI